MPDHEADGRITHTQGDAQGEYSHDENHDARPVNGADEVERVNAEYRANPRRAAAPPADPEPYQPPWANDTQDTDADTAETDSKRGVGSAIASFFAPAPKDRQKSKNKTTTKRDANKRQRGMRFGVRYGGDRIRWFLLQAGIVAFALLALLAFVIASGKAGKGDVNAAVDAALEERGQSFPRGQAVMWAGQIVRVWGTWDADAADSRKVLLAPYLSQGMDEQAGWNETGEQEVVYASVNPEPEVIDENHAMVDVTYQIEDGTWRCVAVPVYAYHPDEFSGDAPWAFALSGNPVPTTCTPRTGAPNLTGGDDPHEGLTPDDDIGDTLAEDFFPGFFAAWAASDADALTQYTASGVTTMGLGGAMASVPPPTIGDTVLYTDKDGVEENKVYQAVTTVTWTVNGSPSQVEATYTVPMKKDGDRWYVAGEPTATMQAPDVGGSGPASIPEPDDGIERDDYDSSTTEPTTPPETTKPTSGTEDTKPPDDDESDKNTKKQQETDKKKSKKGNSKSSNKKSKGKKR